MKNALHLHHRRTERKPDSLPTRVEVYLQDHGPATAAEIADALGIQSNRASSAVACLIRMTPAAAHVYARRDNGAAIYAAGPEPVRKVQPLGPVAQPRTHIGQGPYNPGPWSAPRPGTSQQELGIPSRTFYQGRAA